MSFIETIPFIRLVKEEINLFRFRKKGREDERIPSVQLDFKLQRRKKQFMKPIPSLLPPSFCASSPSLPVVNFIPFLLLTNETASRPPSPLPVLSSSSISLFFFCPRLFPPSSSLPVSPPWSCSWIPSNHFPPDRRAAERGILFFLAKKRDISENPRAWLGERLEGARRVSFGLHSIYPCSFGSKIEKPEKDQTLHRFSPFALVDRQMVSSPPHFSEEQALRSELGKPRGGTFWSTWRSGQEYNFICGDVICWPFHATIPLLYRVGKTCRKVPRITF